MAALKIYEGLSWRKIGHLLTLPTTLTSLKSLQLLIGRIVCYETAPNTSVKVHYTVSRIVCYETAPNTSVKLHYTVLLKRLRHSCISSKCKEQAMVNLTRIQLKG